MNHESDALLQRVRERLAERQSLLVAYSGGLDSCVLLHLLWRLRQQFPALSVRAVHIHHGLSAHAQEWVDHCRQQCLRWQIPLTVVRVTVAPELGGIEAAAREARYTALMAQLASGETLLTAQHLNDQCETLLLALKRGSGPAGLSAMASLSLFGQGELLRPLLDSARSTLEHYARQQGLTWIEDDSNGDERFDRNFLRLRVLPPLFERWPHFADACARSASLCAEQEQLLDELLQETLTQLSDAQGSLAIDGMISMSSPRRDAVLRRWLAAQGALMPSREQLRRLWHEVALSREDAEPRLQWGQVQVRRYRQRLYLLPLLASLRRHILPWSGEGALPLPDNLGFIDDHQDGILLRAPHSNEPLSVRFSAVGSFSIVGRQRSRQIKKLWQEFGIPPWERERIPLIYFGEQLMAAPGVFICKDAQARQGEATISARWVKTQ